MDKFSGSDLMGHASRIAAAYISTSATSIDELPNLVNRIMQMLNDVSRSPYSSKISTSLTPAVPISESITDEYIICLEDGKKLQMLKRHLSSVYGITLDEYKERWGLPADYPVVSPSYARRRSSIAKNIGLGKTGRKPKIRVMQGSETEKGQEQVAILVG